jgi:hypothetical protein
MGNPASGFNGSQSMVVTGTSRGSESNRKGAKINNNSKMRESEFDFDM